MTDTTEETTDSGALGADYVSDRKFADFPISEEVLKGILDMGFETATPVQAATVDAAVAGKDMLVRAKTGTGKTAAFSIPLVERTPAGHRKPFGLILEPTRELAQQTAAELEKIAKYKDLRIVTLVGGLAMGPQEDALKAGAEILVGTPGRVLDHLRRKNLNGADLQAVCLDEADEMLSMGFFEDVNKIINATAEGRQVLLFSATIGADTQRLVQRFLKEPEEVFLSTDADGVELIDHVIYETQHGVHKARALLYLLDLEAPTSAIIFCNTREDTATVATFLDRQGLDVQLLSGELSQSRRSAVMKKVKAGEVRFLVATDVAARGIDISDLSHVINYSLPADPAVYLHRSGRTGRIGKKGTALNLVGGADLSTRRALENKHGISFEERTLPSPEDAVKLRVHRQADQIKAALGNLVFESYMPTVDALLERPDGKMLLAAALRAFFQWDRARKASVEEASPVAKPERSRDRKGRKRDEGRSERRRGDRKPRGRSREKASEDIGDIDALLVDGDEASTSEDKPKPKKRRRKRKTSAEKSESSAPKASAEMDDLDALLSMD